jgi:hypothetical protein
MSATSSGFGAAPNAPFWLVSDRRAVGLVPGQYVIGRGADVEIQLLSDPNVSRRHVRLSVTVDVVEVEDLGSSNGTYLDGKLVQHPLRMSVGSRLRVGAEEFELRRLRPARRKEAITTSPDIRIPRPGFVEDPSSPDAATRQESPVDMVYDQVLALLDKGRVDDARRFVDPLLGLLELGHRPLQPAALERVAVVALSFGQAANEGRYVDWVVAEHRRRGRLMGPRTVELFERALVAGVALEEEPLEAYLAAVAELGLAGTPAERALLERVRDVAATRGFTVPAPPPRE